MGSNRVQESVPSIPRPGQKQLALESLGSSPRSQLVSGWPASAPNVG